MYTHDRTRRFGVISSVGSAKLKQSFTKSSCFFCLHLVPNFLLRRSKVTSLTAACLLYKWKQKHELEIPFLEAKHANIIVHQTACRTPAGLVIPICSRQIFKYLHLVTSLSELRYFVEFLQEKVCGIEKQNFNFSIINFFAGYSFSIQRIN